MVRWKRTVPAYGAVYLCSKLLAPTVNLSPSWRVVIEDCLEP
jgi:hypothetical protein